MLLMYLYLQIKILHMVVDLFTPGSHMCVCAPVFVCMHVCVCTPNQKAYVGGTNVYYTVTEQYLFSVLLLCILQ
jgi:hypothetical protein